ncbi:hypothetical protein HMF8227_02525 [Saliniradius amylolyticus]|uniref:DUF3718 domain-containing protein n=1 Tax=Saliniradius amylolyticus TaxID=2183582 RepID=A0A2S2E7Q0_9ALTE|nr:DUF3718 domain-containing protein [Saliniradius amylolyticus]AWL12977.1 hypothetical protein HMF8227_02525 [Saliniradius amylolyticus]
MKSAIYLLVGATAVAGLTISDVAYSSSFNNDLVSVCRHAANNDRTDLNRAVKRLTPGSLITTGTYSKLAKGLVCNGMPVAEFANYYGANKTYWLFQRHIDRTRKVIEIKDVYGRVQDRPSVPEAITVSWETAY